MVDPVAGLVDLGRTGGQIQGAADAGQAIEAGQARGAWGRRAQRSLGQAAIQQHRSPQGKAHRQQGTPLGQLARLGEQRQQVAIALGRVGALGQGAAQAGAAQVGTQHAKAILLQELAQAPHARGLARTAQTVEHEHQAPGLAQIAPRREGMGQGLIDWPIKGPIKERQQPLPWPQIRQDGLALIGPKGRHPQRVPQGLEVGAPPGPAWPKRGQTQLGGQGRLQGKTLAWGWQLVSKPVHWAHPARPLPARGRSH